MNTFNNVEDTEIRENQLAADIEQELGGQQPVFKVNKIKAE
jgi:hypothetical protein